MRNKYVQMSLYDTYKCVTASIEDDKPKLFRQLDEHIDWDSLIPARFCLAFYRNIGRPRRGNVSWHLGTCVVITGLPIDDASSITFVIPSW